MDLRRAVFATLILAVVLFADNVKAGFWNFNTGLATQRQTDRDSEENMDSIDFLGSVSHTSPEWNFRLNLHFSWNTQSEQFIGDVWEREGDFLRPLETLIYSGTEGKWSAGADVKENWTPGGGYLLRNLSGRSEIDYVLPGFGYRLQSERVTVEVGTDRLIDPTVQAGSVTWDIWDDVQVTVEGAVDPGAPLSFSGDFSGGRPRADETRRITGSALGILFPIRDGDVLDIKAGGHVGMLEDEAKGLGWEMRISLDMSRYYLNRLSLKGGAVECSGGYVPAWFDAVYPVWRWGLKGEPPLASNQLDGTGDNKRYETLDLIYELGNTFLVSLGADRFEDDSLKRARLFLDLRESGGRGLQASLWSRADGPDEELFQVDENFYARVSALYAFMPHLLVKLTYDRSWAFQEEKESLVPLSSILLGVMYNISL